MCDVLCGLHAIISIADPGLDPGYVSLYHCGRYQPLIFPWAHKSISQIFHMNIFSIDINVQVIAVSPQKMQLLINIILTKRQNLHCDNEDQLAETLKPLNCMALWDHSKVPNTVYGTMFIYRHEKKVLWNVSSKLDYVP